MIRLAVVAWGFLVRDFKTEFSYRLSFLLQLSGLFINALTWYFVARFIAGGNEQLVEATGGLDYFSFVLVGLMVSRFLDVSLSAYAMQIRTEQTTGTLEAMMVTPASLWHIVAASATWSYVFALLQAMLYLVFGVFVFGVQLDVGSIPGAVLAILFTVLAISGIGVFSASFVLYFKRGNPLTFLISTTSFLFGNVVIPTPTLPDQLEWISRLIPISYASNAVRGALLRGESLGQIAPDLMALVLFAVILLPSGLLGARFAVRRAKREGTLIQY